MPDIDATPSASAVSRENVGQTKLWSPRYERFHTLASLLMSRFRALRRCMRQFSGSPIARPGAGNDP